MQFLMHKKRLSDRLVGPFFGGSQRDRLNLKLKMWNVHIRWSPFQGTWPAGTDVQSSRKQGGAGKGKQLFKLENRQKNQIRFRYIEKSSSILSNPALIMEEIQSNFLIRQFYRLPLRIKQLLLKAKPGSTFLEWRMYKGPFYCHVIRQLFVFSLIRFSKCVGHVLNDKFAKNNKLIEDYSILNKSLAFTSWVPHVNTDLPLSFFSFSSFHLDS